MAARVIDEARQFLPHRVLIEKAGQAALDEWVANEAPDLIPIIEVTKPRISKAQRLLAVTPLLEAGRVVFAHHLNPNGDAWNPSRGSLIHELLDFPFGKHDDMVDGFSQALDGARRYFLDHWASRGDNVIEVHVGSERRDASGRKYRY
jgi:phage terminase large subunit-like protein